MKIIIFYDISENKKRRELVKYLEKIGVRIQYSVFMADLKETDIKKLNAFADGLLKDSEDKFFVYKSAEVCSTKQAKGLPSSYLMI